MSTSFFVPEAGALPLYEQIYRRMVEEIHKKTRVFKETKDESLIDEIEQISNDIMEL